jgi:hypothetical protein
MDVCLGELGLEIEPAEPWQSDVEHEAACHVGKLAPQEVRRRTERLDPESDGAKQVSERLAHRFIVIDDEYDRLFGTSVLASCTLYHEILPRQRALPAIDSTSMRIIELVPSQARTISAAFSRLLAAHEARRF